jgi:hypothetical protein
MSLINPNNINGNFPVFGQDNATQGFRDNFTNIKNNLSITKNELEDLQGKAVLKSALNGTTLSNLMNGVLLTGPQLKAWTQTYYNLGTQTGSVTIDYNQGNYQKFTTVGNVTLSFINWPAASGSGTVGYATQRLWVVVGETSNVPHTLTLPESVSISVSTIKGYDAGTRTITFDSTGDIIFEFNTANGGTSVSIIDLSRNREISSLGMVQLTGAAPTSNTGAEGDLAGMVTVDTDYLYVCIADYTDGMDPIWTRTALTTW